MIAEHDRVILLTAVPAAGLVAGDVGAVVHCYADGKAYEVEFVALDGHTTAVETLEIDQVRAVTQRDMAHARELEVV